ncbi:integral membrane protein [Coniochaeta sp. 2T2.1]|nr:integral membrane protein [Coniochaeta sp. 2T2.1]
MAIIEPAYTKLNLTYPQEPFNNTGSLGNRNASIPSILAGLLVPHIVCTIFLLARVYSRLFVLRKWFHDDTLILAAWLFSTAVCTVYSIAASIPNLSSAVLLGSSQTYTLTTYLGLIFYQVTLLLTKQSILSFYLRMFSSRPIERRLAIFTIAVVTAYGIPLLAISVFQCHPSSSSSFFSHPIPKCFNFTPLLIASASLHTATDAWLIVMIAPVISRLAIPRGQKVALATVLSLSVFVIAASLTRLQLSLHAGYKPEGSTRVTNTLAFFVMTVLECDVALLCACAPTLRPVLARIWPVLMGEAAPAARRRRRRRLRRRGAAGNESGTDEEDSVNLTVVSYHGYPWAQQHDTTGPAQGKAPGTSNLPAEMSIPIPPRPAMLRTPTTLSLQSFMSTITPRSRGHTISARDDREREVLLLADDDDPEVHWGDSQESFVLGVNDPASPSRLSPVSDESDATTETTRRPGRWDDSAARQLDDRTRRSLLDAGQ